MLTLKEKPLQGITISRYLENLRYGLRNLYIKDGKEYSEQEHYINVGRLGEQCRRQVVSSTAHTEAGKHCKHSRSGSNGGSEGDLTTLRGGLSVKAIPKSCIGATQSLTYMYSTVSMPPSPTLLPSLCRDDILAAVKDQKGLFEGATGPRIKAQESQKLLAMLFYAALPPGRAKEFQTLHVAIHDKLPMPVVDQARPNCLYITTDGRQAYLLLADYKTHKSYGDHFLPLDEDSQLLSHLVIHLNHHRKVLLGAGQQTTALFLVSTRHTYNYIWYTYACIHHHRNHHYHHHTAVVVL